MFSGAAFKGILEVNDFRTNAAVFSEHFSGRRMRLLVAPAAAQEEDAALLAHHPPLGVKCGFCSVLVESFNVAFLSFLSAIKSGCSFQQELSRTVSGQPGWRRHSSGSPLLPPLQFLLVFTTLLFSSTKFKVQLFTYCVRN